MTPEVVSEQLFGVTPTAIWSRAVAIVVLRNCLEPKLFQASTFQN